MVGGGVNSFPGRGDYSSGRNWMKIARIIGFVFFGIYSVLFLMGIFGASIDVGNWISIVFIFVSLLSFLVYYYGFVVLAKKVDSHLLKVSAIILMVAISIFLVLIIIAIISSFSPLSTLAPTGSGGSGLGVPVEDNSSPILGYVFLAFFVFLIITRYLFVISLIRIRNSARFAMIAGIIGLIVMIISTLAILWIVYMYFFDKMGLALFVISLLFDRTKQLIFLWSIYIIYALGLTGLFFESLTLLKASRK
ncbi:MAG: hypothetical protein KKF50_04420 [Nanoarchaeota archaeon]|nr:hypothetical protein [Nanoarchaeota archaeon]